MHHVLTTLRGRLLLLFGAVLIGAIERNAVAVSNLVHELQKERGLSAGFIGSQGARFGADLEKQRQRTDAARTALGDEVARLGPEDLPASLRQSLDQGVDNLNKLADMRQSVSALQVAGPDSFGYYTQSIDHLLAMVGKATAFTDQAEITKLVMAYNQFINAKEQAGRERATVNGILSANVALTVPLFHRLQTIVTAQEVYLANFRLLAGAAEQEALDKLLASAPAQDTARMRGIAVAKAFEGNFGLEPAQWFATITAKINAMKDYEGSLPGQLKTRVGQFEDAGLSGMLVSGGGALAVLALAATFFWVMTGMLGRLSRCVSAAESLAEGDLTVQLETQKKDEIDQLLNAMETMVEHLSSTITQVRKAADNLTSASGQINAPAQSLSQSSSQQAGSVEATSAAIEEMSGQSGQLQQLMAFFRLAEGGGPARPASAAKRGLPPGKRPPPARAGSAPSSIDFVRF